MLMTREAIDDMKFRYERRLDPTLEDLKSVQHLLCQGIIKIEEKDGKINHALAMLDDAITEVSLV